VFTSYNIRLMAEYTRNDDGTWTVTFEESDSGDRDGVHDKAVPRYLAALDPAFTKAHEQCESEFVKALLRVSSLQDAGWDPYETTLRAIPAILQLHALIPEGEEYYEMSRHLALWTYGHIIEASEPYAILGDMLDIAGGGWFKGAMRFPDLPARRQREGESPLQVPKRPQRFLDEKLPELERLAEAIGESGVLDPIREVWDRDLRNAVFHADYSIHGGETRIPAKGKRYSHDELQTLVNLALAYHNALAVIHEVHIQSYTEPVAVRLHPEIASAPDEEMVVMVREGRGAIGLRYVYTPEQVAAGAISAHIARLYPDEAAAIQADPMLVRLPARTES
jgi:hypothetical protein